MRARAEITGRYAVAYVRASKKTKGLILDEVVAVTGWSRDNARRRLTRAAAGAKSVRGRVRRSPVPVPARKPRASKYSYDALKVLQRVWAYSGGLCGKYLVVAMPALLDALERFGELTDEKDRYGPSVRAELEAMSAATIDRYLRPAKARDPIRGIGTTKPSPMLRTSIKIRKAGDEVEDDPGFFETDTVAHCGPSLKGEFQRSVNLTDMRTGWTFTRSIRNNAAVHVRGALQHAYEQIPFPVLGLDFDNGSEFLNHDIVAWAADLDIYFTRSRPYKKNDQATVESKNGHLVRRWAFYYRYDTDETLRVLNRLWPLVNDWCNLIAPTKKPIGWGEDKAGRRKRLYDTPATPCDRLLASGILNDAERAELIAYRDALNPADLQRRIADLQTRLRVLAAERTDQMRHDHRSPQPPDTARGIRIARPA